jgi:hypothetical protein
MAANPKRGRRTSGVRRRNMEAAFTGTVTEQTEEYSPQRTHESTREDRRKRGKIEFNLI